MESIAASAVGLSGNSCMAPYSQNVEIYASLDFHILGGALNRGLHQNVEMSFQDKNGGPNHLKAWREKRRMSQQELADAIKTTPSVISYLEQGERGLSAKWLRKLAPVLKITPGILLDHHPDNAPDDVIEMWTHAPDHQRQQASDMFKVILREERTG